MDTLYHAEFSHLTEICMYGDNYAGNTSSLSISIIAISLILRMFTYPATCLTFVRKQRGHRRNKRKKQPSKIKFALCPKSPLPVRPTSPCWSFSFVTNRIADRQLWSTTLILSPHQQLSYSPAYIWCSIIPTVTTSELCTMSFQQSAHLLHLQGLHKCQLLGPTLEPLCPIPCVNAATTLRLWCERYCQHFCGNSSFVRVHRHAFTGTQTLGHRPPLCVDKRETDTPFPSQLDYDTQLIFADGSFSSHLHLGG